MLETESIGLYVTNYIRWSVTQRNLNYSSKIPKLCKHKPNVFMEALEILKFLLSIHWILRCCYKVEHLERQPSVCLGFHSLSFTVLLSGCLYCWKTSILYIYWIKYKARAQINDYIPHSQCFSPLSAMSFSFFLNIFTLRCWKCQLFTLPIFPETRACLLKQPSCN